MKKGFQVSHNAEDHFVLKHGDGHEIKVAKKGLSTKLQKEIESFGCGGMVGYADGGEVQVPDPTADMTAPNATNVSTGAPVDTGTMPAPTPQVPQAPPVQQNIARPVTTPRNPQAVTGSSDLANQAATFSNAAQEQKSGERKMAEAEAQKGAIESDYLSRGNKAMEGMMRDYTTDRQRLDAEHAQIVKNIGEGKIDPNGAWHNRSTLGKVTSILGILIGGFAGKNGNAALDMLDKQTQRDIEAQKANLGQQNTLLEANLKEYGNLHVATQATMTQMMTIMKGQMMEAAARTADPVAKANMLKNIGLIDERLGPKLDALNWGVTMDNQAKKNGGVPDPAMMIRVRALQGMPEADQKLAIEELSKYEKTAEAHRAADSILDKFQQEAPLSINPIQRSKRLKLYSGQLTPLVMHVEPSKRLTPESYEKEIHPFIQGAMDNPNTVKQIGEGLHNIINTNGEPTPTLRKWNIALPPHPIKPRTAKK